MNKIILHASSSFCITILWLSVCDVSVHFILAFSVFYAFDDGGSRKSKINPNRQYFVRITHTTPTPCDVLGFGDLATTRWSRFWSCRRALTRARMTGSDSRFRSRDQCKNMIERDQTSSDRYCVMCCSRDRAYPYSIDVYEVAQLRSRTSRDAAHFAVDVQSSHWNGCRLYDFSLSIKVGSHGTPPLSVCVVVAPKRKCTTADNL